MALTMRSVWSLSLLLVLMNKNFKKIMFGDVTKGDVGYLILRTMQSTAT